MAQGGSGLHIFNRSTFNYMCGKDVATVTPEISEISDKDVKDVLQQVCYCKRQWISCVLC